MSSMNRRTSSFDTNQAFGSTKADKLTLNRLVLANMLWENQFYAKGNETAKSIRNLIQSKKVDPAYVAELAQKARTDYKLRHTPLFLTRELARIGALKADMLTSVIQRPDEMGEFLSMYWADGKVPVSNQVKKGLANAFVKFNEYQLAKWDKNSAAVSIRDVMFVSHPKPTSAAQTELFKKVANQQLETPDTWETELSAGADKKATFTRLMQEKKLGALAFLRNLRNMVNAGVDESLIRQYGYSVNVEKVLPFRFIAAYRIVPHFGDMLETMMFTALKSMPRIEGKTSIMVDVSGSMFGTKISEKSDLDRFDAAAALAILCKELCEEVEIFTFSNSLVKVNNPISGFQLADQLKNSQSNAGTYLGSSLRYLAGHGKYDRTIVITDEMSGDAVRNPNANLGTGYVINVAAYSQTGIDYGTKWVRITGFSEAVFDFIRELEALEASM